MLGVRLKLWITVPKVCYKWTALWMALTQFCIKGLDPD